MESSVVQGPSWTHVATWSKFQNRFGRKNFFSKIYISNKAYKFYSTCVSFEIADTNHGAEKDWERNRVRMIEWEKVRGTRRERETDWEKEKNRERKKQREIERFSL